MNRRVLISGASGFIGRHCLEPLVRRGFEVHAVSRKVLDVPGVISHQVDLLDAKSRKGLVEEVTPSHLLHLAWYLEPGHYQESPVNLDWLAASIDLVRSFRMAGGERLVGVGTCFEYDWSQGKLTEDTVLRPRTMYGHAKRLLFEALLSWAERDGPEFAWARIFFLFGPGEDNRRLVGDVANSLLSGQEVRTSSGLQRRDYMFVEDAAEVLVALLDSSVDGAINVATGNAIPVGELVGAVAERIGRRDLVRFGARPSPVGDPDCLEADVARLESEVDWAGFTPLADAVDKTVTWWESQLRERT